MSLLNLGNFEFLSRITISITLQLYTVQTIVDGIFICTLFTITFVYTLYVNGHSSFQTLHCDTKTITYKQVQDKHSNCLQMVLLPTKVILHYLVLKKKSFKSRQYGFIIWLVFKIVKYGGTNFTKQKNIGFSAVI